MPCWCMKLTVIRNAEEGEGLLLLNICVRVLPIKALAQCPPRSMIAQAEEFGFIFTTKGMATTTITYYSLVQARSSASVFAHLAQSLPGIASQIMSRPMFTQLVFH
jgi:hypothetical protein